MKFLSLCSGIEAASVAWNPLGWEAVAFSEIEPFPNAVLAHHYPDTPNLGDMTKYNEWNIPSTDIICGGTPCQAFSVAGLRGGLADPRGNLTLTFLGAVDRFRPRWVVWENVPGILSDDTGALGAFLGGLGQLGYGFAYRILNAQYFGVPQRRRRIIVVGYLGDWRRAAAVLFERHGLQGHPAPGGKAGKTAAPPSEGGPRVGSHWDGESIHPTLNQSYNTGGIGFSNQEIFSQRGAGLVPAVSPTVSAKWAKSSGGGIGRGGDPSFSVTRSPQAIAYRTAGDGAVYEEGDKTSALTTGTDRCSNVLAFAQNQLGEVRVSDVVGTLNQNSNASGRCTPMVSEGYRVRRLTPLECERLQGFPDNYTLVNYRGKPASDGPRYKAIGNSWAVPVFRWVGERIQRVEQLRKH